MKPFSHQRTKRNTTFVTLLVWLFATVSGMANACLLETPAKHLHIALNYSEHHPHSPASTGPTATVDEHDDDLDASKESCLKACDDGANAPVKLQTGVVYHYAVAMLLGLAAIMSWFMLGLGGVT